MVKSNFNRPQPTRNWNQEGKSKGILDDYAERGNVNTNEGTITKAPVEEIDIVNKEYVDSLIRGNVELFLTEDSSDIGTYFDLTIDNTGNPEEDIAQTITAGGTTLIASFASILNETEIEAITDLELGIYSMHIHAEANFPNGMTVYFEFYRRISGGTETLIATSHDSDILTVADSQYELHANVASDLIWDTGDRVVVKIYGRNTNAATKTITIHVEGDTLSRVEFPAFIPPTFVGPHTIVSHSDTTATGTELDTLTGGGDTTLHDHDGISENTTHRGSDGSNHSKVTANETAIGLNTTHRGLTNDPHNVTASQVGLGSVSNVATDDTAYNATSWNNNLDAATKNAIRDKIEALPGGHDAVTLNASATTGGMSLSTQEISNRAATNAQTGYMTAVLVGNIETNNAKNTNVSTNLSMGTVDGTQYNINSSDGTNVALPLADTNNWGIISDEIFDEIAANTAKTSYTKTNVKGHVAHGGTAGTARASGFTSVEWVGTVEPTNAVNGDTWIDTT